MIIKNFSLLSLILLFLSTNTSAGEWLTNFEEARKKAAEENKALMVNFTGTDWCGYCINLHREVFKKDEFTNYAKEKFILLEIDFPRRKEQGDELKKQNKELAGKYSVRGYPTILIITQTF